MVAQTLAVGIGNSFLKMKLLLWLLMSTLVTVAVAAVAAVAAPVDTAVIAVTNKTAPI
jgi:hypothetical protein